MKENEFLDGVSNIDSDIVERFISMDNRLKNQASKRSIWVRVGALAASFLIVASVVFSIVSNIIPTWNFAHYSVSDIEKLSPSYKAYGYTSAYQTIYIPDEQYLYINEIPDSKYLPVYKYSSTGKALSKKELKNFANGLLPRLSKSLGTDIPKYEIEKDSHLDGDSALKARTSMGDFRIYLQQNKTHNQLELHNNSGDDNKSEIVLGGETVRIDQYLSDEEILESLESIKNKLFDIFRVSFKDAKIVRTFNGNSAKKIRIYLYNEDAHSLNKYIQAPVSDYIEIYFDNFENFEDDIVSNCFSTHSCIYYSENRVSPSRAYDHIAYAKRISLKKAEKLLYKGFVFGGNTCPICTASQERISFEDYDFVGIEYLSNTSYSSDVLPFYAFYKKIKTYSSGTIVYAKTYVPAIQIRGYEAYFESHYDNH